MCARETDRKRYERGGKQVRKNGEGQKEARGLKERKE